jgi:hypothetical protein
MPRSNVTPASITVGRKRPTLLGHVSRDRMRSTVAGRLDDVTVHRLQKMAGM